MSLSYRKVFWSNSPRKWKDIKLGKIIERKNKRYKDIKNNDIPVLTVTNDKGFIKPEEKFDKKVASDDLRDYKIVKMGQFAYNPARINVGSIALLDNFEIGLISPMYEVFEVNDDVYVDFIKYFFKSNKAISLYDAFSQGSVRQTLKFDLMSDIPYVLPPLPEQKKIADILSSVDKTIEKTDEIIEKTEKLKKGLMQELLTKGIGHDEFKEVSLGPKKTSVPSDWRIETLDDLIELRNGKFNPTDNLSDANDIPVYGGNGITGYHDSALIKESTIVIGRVGAYCGSIHLVKDNCWVTDNAIYVKEIKQPSMINIDFLAKLLKYRNLNRLSNRTGQPKLTQGRLLAEEIPVPPMHEQKKIATILSSVDNKIQKEKQYKEKLEKLKKGLMQKLLTGEVRVKTSN